ncbi:MAG: hypothetical protein MUO62_15540, partial [Anaerolineales bacterium]|nr:hypothetical protein [Anaerolineales bacterium]
QLSFFLGASSGALLGGVLTDWMGFHSAMILNSALSFLGTIVALVALPETRDVKIKSKESSKNNNRSPLVFTPG